MDWLIANWSYILSGLFGLVFIASVICKLTKTTEDDAVMNKILSVLDNFSIAQTQRNKQILDSAEKVMAGEDNNK